MELTPPRRGLVAATGPTPRRPRLFELMALVAGAALGLWLVAKDFGTAAGPGMDVWVAVLIMGLGGLSLVGPPLLLAERRRRGPWRAGQLLWFAQGMASWLMWPPIVYTRARGQQMGDSTTAICYYYGTPLMALYVTAALLAGGWLRPGRRRALRRSWREQFGLLLGLAWACTGLYVLFQLYAGDFD